MIVENLYTSVGVNQTPSALDWGCNGLICYGAGNSVAILDPAVSEMRNIFRNLFHFIFLV